MSRPSLIWVLLWLVLGAMCIAVVLALKSPDEQQAVPSPPKTTEGVLERMEIQRPTQPSPNPPANSGGGDGGLLHSLPAPQSPPDNLSAVAKKRWLDDLMTLIDDASYLDDEASLRMLIVEFRNPDAAIAEAARASLMARADPKALPYLEEMQAVELKADKRRQLEELIGFLGKQGVFERIRNKDL